MDQIADYIQPELLIVALVLYFVGKGLKNFPAVKDKYIPVILGVCGVVICSVWVLASCPLSEGKDVAMAVFTAVTQGILVAGLSTYIHQLIKQTSKKE